MRSYDERFLLESFNEALINNLPPIIPFLSLLPIKRSIDPVNTFHQLTWDGSVTLHYDINRDVLSQNINHEMLALSVDMAKKFVERFEDAFFDGSFDRYMDDNSVALECVVPPDDKMSYLYALCNQIVQREYGWQPYMVVVDRGTYFRLVTEAQRIVGGLDFGLSGEQGAPCFRLFNNKFVVTYYTDDLTNTYFINLNNMYLIKYDDGLYNTSVEAKESVFDFSSSEVTVRMSTKFELHIRKPYNTFYKAPRMV